MKWGLGHLKVPVNINTKKFKDLSDIKAKVCRCSAIVQLNSIEGISLSYT